MTCPESNARSSHHTLSTRSWPASVNSPTGRCFLLHFPRPQEHNPNSQGHPSARHSPYGGGRALINKTTALCPFRTESKKLIWARRLARARDMFASLHCAIFVFISPSGHSDRHVPVYLFIGLAAVMATVPAFGHNGSVFAVRS
ncbi:hypothetical protein DdX_15063 [Ditylenchus destructor]|uniref:Uncharacterized protein n=1 Tax=Ditylenchus destructor TaxID=166010 RepID=A0AAD4MRK8_9BILA|nr:hypothetical protein DdX_15063 [Ditylenchus destructor]